MHRGRFLAYGTACVVLYVCFVMVFAGYATHRAKRECLQLVSKPLIAEVDEKQEERQKKVEGQKWA